MLISLETSQFPLNIKWISFTSQMEAERFDSFIFWQTEFGYYLLQLLIPALLNK